jgi:GT2 family glycosyltransferase
MNPSVSIIIATASRFESLRETLLSLSGVRIPEEFVVELVLVENGVRSGIEQWLPSLPPHAFTIRYIHEAVAGKSRALNLAVKEAAGEILLFTDDDVRFPREWLVEMCTPLAWGEGDVVVGGCRLAPHLMRKWMGAYHMGFLASTEYLSDTDPSEFAGVNAACRRAVLEKVPEFDCELGSASLHRGEDALFARQLKRAGYRFVSRTRVIVEHHPLAKRLTYESWIRTAVACGRSRAYILHHWDHAEMPFARIELYSLRLKLFLRLLLTGRRVLEAEGIPEWELRYRQDIAELETFIQIRRGPRNYTRRGLKYLKQQPQPVFV